MSRTEETTQQSPRLPAPAETGLQPITDYDRIFRKFHQHNISDSTNNTGSNTSSPTTTISTIDDSSATEPSPGSSPESPPPTTFAVGMLQARTAEHRKGAFFELQKQPPPRKGRNLKNLAVNTSRPPRAASTTSLPLEAPHAQTASILSPSFVKPPTPPRRRPSNLGLTILTPGASKPPPQEVRLTIPPTPSFYRPGTLRHFQSSPSLPLVPILGFPHHGQIESLHHQQSLDTIFSPVAAAEDPKIDEEDEQNFDIPLSQEEKPEAYPDGPICVYDPSVDLYLEPTAEQARRYDVIMNVASEVRNPFIQHHEPTSSEPDLRLDGGGGIQYAPKRSHLAAQTAPQSSTHDSSPTTPKATPLESLFPADSMPELPTKDPEYIHIPWEHNSDIVPDLLRLVKQIDEKVSEGKRVLVHCQCGVSRSASLVVAYGLYKNPKLSVQEAYDAVKKRSKWIGPNMNLIMQLQEFRSSLEKGGVLAGNRCVSPNTPSSAISEWRSPFSRHEPSLSGSNEPLSAVVGPSTTLRPSTSATAVSPGPSSAPSGFAWPTINPSQRCRSTSAVKPTAAYVDPSGHVVPALKIIDTDKVYKPQTSIRVPPMNGLSRRVPMPSKPAPRVAEVAMIPLHPSEDVAPADSFGIMSPTSTEFASNPFDRSALLASLGMGSMRADEETPRRSLSLRHRQNQVSQLGEGGLQAHPLRRLRGKISSPTLREQQQLQSLQAKIEASLPIRNGLPRPTESSTDDALMSPRATEFTDNPFALSLSAIPQSPADDAHQHHPPRVADADPRSPAHKGASPITRNILDVL